MSDTSVCRGGAAKRKCLLQNDRNPLRRCAISVPSTRRRAVSELNPDLCLAHVHQRGPCTSEGKEARIGRRDYTQILAFLPVDCVIELLPSLAFCAFGVDTDASVVSYEVKQYCLVVLGLAAEEFPRFRCHIHLQSVVSNL